MSTYYGKIFEEEMEKLQNRGSVFEDFEKASPQYLPENPVHREDVLARLSKTLVSGNGADSGEWVLIKINRGKGRRPGRCTV
ncbi:hypothetical protein AKJ49_00805 [candidate division MSBL1 archaeon SCGC-AAA382A03]|uniref:Uncharacterized protein n=1 Tax=candidate division MSBL1 archaeon SCGC-AAA382A03 TaxID=1698278 RepID=A0A133VG70_9EURY|nr:hypothetical protein AKJ49_00805 [candidate division MSBL1 archaeon SCGC-AAA382A03]